METEKVDITWDIESNQLLNTAIDFTASPYRLKPSFELHCIAVEEHGGDVIVFHDGPKYVFDGRPHKETIYHPLTGYVDYVLEDYTPVDYVHRPLKAFGAYVRSGKIRRVIGHNIINFDLLAVKLWGDIDYEVSPDTWGGMEVEFIDTLVMSKTLNPDRRGGHRLEALASKNSVQKFDFRPDMPADKKFLVLAADMVYYNIFDVKANTLVWKALEAEKGAWGWDAALELEKEVAHIVSLQERRGFLFDKELAEENVCFLDGEMEKIREQIEPVIPDKPATKAFLKDMTPPKRQFLKTGKGLQAPFEKFLARHGGEVIYENQKPTEVLLYGKKYKLPLAQEPLVSFQKAQISDSSHIKDWLVGIGWRPLEYKERDLSLDSKKKMYSEDQFKVVVDKYVTQTLNSNFKKDRLAFLGVKEEELKPFLLKKYGKRCKVATNPSFTVGQEKRLCDNLLLLADKFPYAREIANYYTYRHRRNSILGSKFERDDEEPSKGFISLTREDGRISTPADTCGTPTARMKHKEVANIPRTTSLFGKEMRAMFGVDKKTHYQAGYDFASLEARIEAHYCWKYDLTKEYCNSLLLSKPLDVHTKTAEAIQKILNRPFARDSAKPVKYGCTYGATGPKVAKIIGSDENTGELVVKTFWEVAAPLARLKANLERFWENQGQKQFIIGIDGRKVPTRAKHALLNSLFQSAGVICAKKAMVLHYKKLKKAGLTVDFFREDWQNKLFCQQLIAYHDEAQCEVSKNLMTFKYFSWEKLGREIKETPELQAEEDARCKKVVEAWREEEQNRTGKFWGEVQKSPKGGFFCAYSEACHYIVEAVREAGEHYRLNIPLAADYCVGYNWKDCH